jgi:hypothetical protein
MISRKHVDACHTAGTRGSASQLGGPVPGQEVVDAIHRMVGYTHQHVTQPGFGVNSVQPGRSDKPIHDSGVFAAAVGAGKQVVASAQGDAAQRAPGGRVVDLDAAVFAIACQRWPQLEGVQDRRCRIGFTR